MICIFIFNYEQRNFKQLEIVQYLTRGIYYTWRLLHVASDHQTGWFPSLRSPWRRRPVGSPGLPSGRSFPQPRLLFCVRTSMLLGPGAHIFPKSNLSPPPLTLKNICISAIILILPISPQSHLFVLLLLELVAKGDVVLERGVLDPGLLGDVGNPSRQINLVIVWLW